MLKAQGLSDRAIGRLLGCSRETVFAYRKALGIQPSKWRTDAGFRRMENAARNAELDRLWLRLTLDEKIGLLTKVHRRGTEARRQA